MEQFCKRDLKQLEKDNSFETKFLAIGIGRTGGFLFKSEVEQVQNSSIPL